MISQHVFLAQTDGESGKITGFQWHVLAQLVEELFPFSEFHFEESGFAILRYEPPQFLVIRPDASIAWDSDEGLISSWDRFFSRGFAQLRNNLAHGSKQYPPAPFTHGRTPAFIAAGHAVIDFLSAAVFERPDWEEPIGHW